MYYLSSELWFPDVEKASEDGLLAIGGDLSPKRLLLAYESGIFPWFEDRQQLMWWSPDPRMILFPSNFKVSKSLRKVIEGERFKVTFALVVPLLIIAAIIEGVLIFYFG